MIKYQWIVVDHDEVVLRPDDVVVNVPDGEINALVADDLQRRIAIRPSVEIF